MSLSQSEQQQARANAERRYAAAHPELTTSAGMESDPEFQRMYCDEAAAIEAAHVPPPPSSTARCDDTTSSCHPPVEPTETVNCNFTSMQVNKSGDTNRVFRSTAARSGVIDIVAGRTRAKATMELRLQGVSITCDDHDHRVWNVSPQVPGAVLTNNSSLNLDLGWTGDVSRLGFFNQRIAPTRYEVTASTHNKSKSITINVYPDYAWEGTASVSFRVEEGTRNIRYDGVNIQFSRTDDNVTTQYGARIQEIIDLLARFFGFIFDVKHIAETVTAGAVTWGLVPPTFAISMNTKWQENTTNLRCGYYYTLRLAFSPLIGIQLTVNLGIIAIQAIPYIGTLVARMAGPEISRYIAITFTIQGTIGVDVTASKSAEAGSGSVSGGLTGQVGMDIGIRGQVNRDFGLFAVNCGISGGARGSVTLTLRGPQIDTAGSYASFAANFDGLTLYVRAYCRAGSSQTTRQETPGRSYSSGYTGEDGSWQVRDTAHHVAGETNREQAGGNGEETYLWIAARPLGDPARIDL